MVGVTVTDSAGHFISGLQRDAFRLFDNEVEQPVVDFLPVEEPAQFLLLIESGPAVLLFAKDHVLAADRLLGSVAADDRVALATYTRGPELLVDLTTNKLLARMALGAIDFHSGYGELNLRTSISSAVGWMAQLPGKKSVVLLSTGVDSSQQPDWVSLSSKLQTTDVKIIPVSLSAEIRKPVNPRKMSPAQKDAREKIAKDFAKADELLRNLAIATGGRCYFPQSQAEFAKTYQEISELLRHEYILAFAPPAVDGKIHQLHVEVKREGLKVDHRPAYLAAASNGLENQRLGRDAVPHAH